MNKWEMVRLGDVLEYEQPTKYLVESDNYSPNYKIPVLTAGKTFILGYTDEKKGIFSHTPVIIFDDFTTAIKYVDFEFKVKSSAMKILRPTTSIYLKYIFYLMTRITIDTQLHKRYWISMYSNIKIPLPPLEEQKKIAQELDSIQNLIAKRKDQLEKMDLLVKAKFVEMFGDPVANPMGWEVVQLGKICAKITDGKHGGCTKVEDSGYYFVGAREIFNNKINYDTAPQIPEAEFEKDYKRCNIENDDFIIVNTGATIGKSAVVNHELTTKTLLQKSVALIKTKKHTLSTIYLKFCYALNTKLYHVAGASAQPNLLLSQIRETCIPLPPIDLQNQFADYVQQTEKLKNTMHSGLEKLELLYNSKMQEYFG